MKRYLVFGWSDYYGGGMCDFAGDFDTRQEAHFKAKSMIIEEDNVDVLDTETRTYDTLTKTWFNGKKVSEWTENVPLPRRKDES